MRVACVLITHLRAKVELRRQPHLAGESVLIVDRSQTRPLVVDRTPAAAGVAAGMTLEQARSRQAGGVVLEADAAAYRRVFRQLLSALQGVSDRVEAAELGTAYVGLDGLDAMYGGEARLVTTLLNAVPHYLKPRVGVGEGKFPALVAARLSRPLGAEQVPPDVAGFLAPYPVDLLPVAVAVRAELRRLGLGTLGDVAALQPALLVDRFGKEGWLAWNLAQGMDDRPLLPLKQEEAIVEHTALPFCSVSLELLLAAVDTLLRRAYAQPRMRGRYAGGAALQCVLQRAVPWEKDFHFKRGVGDWAAASRILRGQLEADHPRAPVAELTLALADLTGESGLQLGLFREVRPDRELRLAEAERQLQARMPGRPTLYRVVQVAPWHPAPELRAVQVPIDAGGAGGMKPLSLPAPASVRAGPEGQPAAVGLPGRGWSRVAGIQDQWCFDLWWQPEPLNRVYYRISREDGREDILFQDRTGGCWYRQGG